MGTHPKGEIQLVPSASYSYWGLHPEIEMCIDLVASGALKVKGLVTHRLPLEKINKAFEVTNDKEKYNSIFTAITFGD